eukprot:7915907-Alexandrium_andersonii.AAC.1
MSSAGVASRKSLPAGQRNKQPLVLPGLLMQHCSRCGGPLRSVEPRLPLLPRCCGCSKALWASWLPACWCQHPTRRLRM